MALEESVLKTVRTLVGLLDDDDSYDSTLLLYINSAFSDLDQIGVGPEGGWFITDDSDTWDELDVPPNQLHALKIYIGLKVRMKFDPPTVGYLITSMENQIKEVEFRLNFNREVAYEPVDN